MEKMLEMKKSTYIHSIVLKQSLTEMLTSFKVVVFDYLFGVINNRRKVNL